jgi:hypothetical protein
MKNICFVLIACASLLFGAPVKSDAQTRVVQLNTITEGNFTDYGGTYNTIFIDSLQVSDSIAYQVYLYHTHDVSPYITWHWNKVGAGTATVTLSFLQSNDNITWFPVQKGIFDSTYKKTYTLAASADNEISFQRDTALVIGRYLKIYYITSATASVEGKLAGRIKLNIK